MQGHAVGKPFDAASGQGDAIARLGGAFDRQGKAFWEKRSALIKNIESPLMLRRPFRRLPKQPNMEKGKKR
jgi:hypothetical protein